MSTTHYIDNFGRRIDIRPDLDAVFARKRQWTGKRMCGAVHGGGECPGCREARRGLWLAASKRRVRRAAQ